MSAKLVVTMLAASLLTVGCVAFPDDPYYRGGGYYHGDQRYDRNDGRRYSEWERKRWEEQRQRVYEQQRKDARAQERARYDWQKKHREWDKKRVEDRDHGDHDRRDYRHDD